MEIPQEVLELDLPMVKCSSCFWAGTRGGRPWCYKLKKKISPNKKACGKLQKAQQKNRAIDKT